ncbi:FAD dependent oxidoreductase-domain-containing protein [Flagelloscypha sp. PMI_526]|nr:FAD dependent oxidoreductase-domain-containing protein [Flagelloscypha sp. PMI_526]
MSGSSSFRRLIPRLAAYASGGTVVAAGAGYWYLNSGPAYPPSTSTSRRPPESAKWSPPTRAENITSLKTQPFDILIVGGGATGAGVALDAATRGLKVALVEKGDFGCGTSSKSTKLVHGGVRYLQKAIFELDWEQWKLVKEALHERRIFLQTAPYLSSMLPIMLPVYHYYQVPYYFAGCKLYDILAGKENMETSYLMSKGKALEQFPMLKSDGLVGAVVYYDGQHNDSRMNISLVMTAVKHGATVANYTEVTSLTKDSAGKVNGARVRDRLTGQEWDIAAQGVVNATGPFTDELMKMDNPSHKDIVQPSSGIHITLPNYYAPRKMGLLDPATSDGRVIFFLPWEGGTIAGTTDTPSNVTIDPEAPEEEIKWILGEVQRYLSPDIQVRRTDVLSAWSGLRPLVRDPTHSTESGATQGLVRNHIVYTNPDSNLVSISGGKWTTYREMAKETVDESVKVFGLQDAVDKGNGANGGCVTERITLLGSEGWNRNMFIGLIQKYNLPPEIAQHLSSSYGSRAWRVCQLAASTSSTSSSPSSWVSAYASYSPPPARGEGRGFERVTPSLPYIKAEIRYAVENEYAVSVIDVIGRRTRLSFLNAKEALKMLPEVVNEMSSLLNWSSLERHRQLELGITFLRSMGLSSLPSYRHSPTPSSVLLLHCASNMGPPSHMAILKTVGRCQERLGRCDVSCIH